MLYFPNAILINEDGKKEPISTYEGFLTKPEAIRQFTIWTEHYNFNLERCWIEQYDGENLVASEPYAINL